MADSTTTVATHGPYEDLAIKALEVVEKIIDKQPADVAAELWRGYLEDVKGWREFWMQVRGVIKP